MHVYIYGNNAEVVIVLCDQQYMDLATSSLASVSTIHSPYSASRMGRCVPRIDQGTLADQMGWNIELN